MNTSLRQLRHVVCRSLYALKILKAHGLTGQAVHTVFKATVQAKLLYCAPAWSGFCSAADRDRLDSFFNHCKKPGYYEVDAESVTHLFNAYDKKLFDQVLSISIAL